MSSVARWGVRLLGPALLGVLLWQSDLDAIGATFASMAPWAFTAAVLGWTANAALKALRWQRLLRVQGVEVSLRRATLWYFAGLFAGGVTPGRLGELAKARLIAEMGHPLVKALFASVVDRVFDIVVLPFVAVAGLAYYGVARSDELALMGLALSAAAMGVAILWRARGVLKIPIRALMPATVRQSVGAGVDEVMRELRQLTPRDYLFHGGLTAACWVVYGTAVAGLALGMSLPVDPVYMAVSALAAALAGLLPVTVMGVGTRDAVLATAFTHVGLDVSDAIALSAAMLALHLTVLGTQLPPYLMVFGRRSGVRPSKQRPPSP